MCYAISALNSLFAIPKYWYCCCFLLLLFLFLVVAVVVVSCGCCSLLLLFRVVSCRFLFCRVVDGVVVVVVGGGCGGVVPIGWFNELGHAAAISIAYFCVVRL